VDEKSGEFECLSVCHGHSQDVKCVVWHPSDELLVSTAYDDTMRVWRADEDDWSCTATLVGHTGTVWCAAFNGDGSRLVSCSDDRSLRLWRYDDADATFSLLHTIENVSKRPLFAVSWSAVNGLVAVAAGDNAIYLFGAADADCTALQLLGSEQRAHDSDVNSVSWSSDGSLLASAGDDAAINVWRVAGNR
jgi:WD40 repeat protein